MKLEGNTVLITGGSSGIGFQLAKELLAKGNVVIITGRSEDKLKKAKALLPQAHTIANDVGSVKDIEALFKRVLAEFPNVNVLVNNAGVMKTINMHVETSLDELTREIEINLMGPIRLTRLFLTHLKSQKNAAVVNVTSGLAFVPLPTSPVYCATKAGLHSFSLSLRVQLQNTNVKVFEVAPPATKTELMDSFDPEDMKDIKIMSVQDMVRDVIRGLEQDNFEIRPGQANQLKLMSRIAPEFILKQMGKSVERMLRA